MVNGHGGNVRSLRREAPGIADELGVRIETCSYWDAIDRDTGHALMESGDWPGHASEFETSIALTAFPERLHYRGIDPRFWDTASYSGVSDTEDDRGKFDFSKLADEEKGERILSLCSAWVADRVRGMTG